jgi:heat shock protein HslJ
MDTAAALQASPPSPSSTPSTSAEKSVPVTAEALAGTSWTARLIDGVGTSSGTWPQLRWTKVGNHIAGTGGCNSFAGEVDIDQGKMRFHSLAATGKACLSSPGGQEDLFFKALEFTRSGLLEGGDLVLRNEQGKTLAQFVRMN